MKLLIQYILLIVVFLSFQDFTFSQSESNIDKKILYRKEHTGFIYVHSEGFGLGYRSGKSKTYFRKFIWQVDALSMKHPKEIKVTNSYDNNKSFIYGKLNNFYLLRGGVGQQHLLNSKPYWGGVEVRAFYSGGISLGFTKPIYLYIVKYNIDNGQHYLEIERSNPDNHAITDIFGKASFFKGFNRIGFYPGIFLKAGFSFEYGSDDKFVKTLECGAFVDCFYKNVPIVAYQKNQFLFANVYIAIHLGKRKF